MDLVYDLSTKNGSFIKMYMYLKAHGVRNNSFMLALTHRELLGVNPYDLNLSTEKKMMIVDECERNIWYFLREVVRIPTQGANNARFELNQNNCATIFNFCLSVPTWSTSPRMTFRTMSIKMIEICKSIARYDEAFIFDRTIGSLPDYLTKAKKIIRKIKGDDVGLYHNTTFAFSPDQINKDDGFAEGANIIHFSDAEYFPHIGDIYKNHEDIFKAYRNRYMALCAQSSGMISEYDAKPFGLFFESTISDNAAEYGAIDIIDSFVRWKNDFYDWPAEYFSEVKGFYIYTGYKDLGYDDEWLKSRSLELNNDQDVIRRELLCKRLN